MIDLLLGADPEVFVRKVGAKRFYQSAHGLNEGTKENPVRVRDGAVQVDGMALEFNIDPARTPDGFLHNVKSVMQQMQDTLPKGLEIVATPVAHFTKKHMDAQPEAAKELGCNPDWNAWTGRVNPRPNGEDITFRTGAGHLHFGWTEGEDITNPHHKEACEILVRTLDNTLGPLCALFDPGVKRRVLYGAPGAYRIKPYGCEYRVLSNAWLKDDETIFWVAQSAMHIFRALQHGMLQASYTRLRKEQVRALSSKDPGKFKRDLTWMCQGTGLTFPPGVAYV